MKTLETKQGYLCVFDRGEEFMSTLTAWAVAQGITAATFSGIGAVEAVNLCFYDLPAKEYLCNTLEHIYEVSSLTGTISLRDGEPFVHAHAVVGDRELRTYGGHLTEATVAVTLEVMVVPMDEEIRRSPDDDTGLHLLDL